MKTTYPVLWLTGNTGAGKSTLAFGVRAYFNEHVDPTHPLARKVVVLDGDEMRATVSVDDGLSPEDRRRHNLRVARLAKLLSEAGHLVVVAVIAPFTNVRAEVDAICAPTWVYVQRSGLGSPDKPYEPPMTPDFIVDNDHCNIQEALSCFISFTLARLVSSNHREAVHMNRL